MSTYREVPCKHYLAFGSCAKGRTASHYKYCQHCGKYEARAHIHVANRKKAYNEKERGKVLEY